ncbi:hypothetical protein PINS_up006020 [Pythium insidiosum]|nr:hypothetical protein PINS_up006020 [Pythium insidiosum]
MSQELQAQPPWLSQHSHEEVQDKQLPTPRDSRRLCLDRCCPVNGSVPYCTLENARRPRSSQVRVAVAHGGLRWWRPDWWLGARWVVGERSYSMSSSLHIRVIHNLALALVDGSVMLVAAVHHASAV